MHTRKLIIENVICVRRCVIFKMPDFPETHHQTEVPVDENVKNTNRWRALIAYWILGLCNNYGYVVMLSAAHDILKKLDTNSDLENTATTQLPINDRQCNLVSTGAILLADIVPALIIKVTAPFLPFYMNARVAICVLLSIGGFLLVAFANSQTLAISGVVLTSLSSGFGEVSFLQYSSFYSKNVVSTWSSGTGGAGILGSISYAGLSYLDLRDALLIMLVVPILLVVAFWIILPKPDSDNSQCLLELEKKIKSTKMKNFWEVFLVRLKLIPGLLQFMIPLALVYLFEYFINQGLFELIQFEDIFLNTAQQYHWLQVDYQLGVFISRSSVNFVHVKKIWLMALLQLINVIIFTSEAIFYFIPTIWIIFALTLWEGLLGGAAYVNTFYKISQDVPEDKKQFSLGATSLADTIGITIAGIAALPVHNAICYLSKPERLSF